MYRWFAWNKQTLCEMLRFGIVGIFMTAFHYGIYELLIHRIRLDALWWDNVAYIIGYGLAFIGNMWLTAHFTFKTQLNVKRGGGFAISHGINLFIHLMLLNLFLWLGFNPKIAPLPVFLIATIVNFLLVRFVFKSKYFQSLTK